MELLIVDDESAVRDSIARALKVDGHNVRTAADGLDALAELADDPVDVIILDVQMPRMNGLMLCRSLRATGDATPILMLTARTSIADRVDGLDAGADDYLVKPFALDELKARLRALVRRNTAIADIENAELRFGDLALNTATRVARRGDRVLDYPHRVLPVGTVVAQPTDRVDPRGHLRPCVGIRLRGELQLAGGLHRVFAPQDRGRR